MSFRSQLLKGILEGCILSIINKEMVYGYELSQKLQHFGLHDVSEGSIYPILLRLQKDGLIKGEMRASSTGPKRKYYELTNLGEKALLEIQEEWKNLQKPVDRLLNRSVDDER
ncbi:PadR family transcriptional regulator [Niallia nealsonii]|uniref:PadR family transcriptional regulator n=1 Tax=Niallia nealsonii TaxID=115979 RepID=A0A2N0YXY2_9BACI|nr:PadR family transcriptional regulator [Niallia nealsonii]PKG22118.1 PadR family transcriptional regulator [Niallia nealsonii]